jgi:hypothetical protein
MRKFNLEVDLKLQLVMVITSAIAHQNLNDMDNPHRGTKRKRYEPPTEVRLELEYNRRLPDTHV